MPLLAANQQPVTDEEPPPVPVHMRKPETSLAIKERRAGIHSVYGNVPLFRNTPPPLVNFQNLYCIEAFQSYLK
jgi:hypothetical protein